MKVYWELFYVIFTAILVLCAAWALYETKNDLATVFLLMAIFMKLKDRHE